MTDVVKIRMAFNADYAPFRAKNPLVKWRIEHKITISEAARLLGTNRQHITSWEHGEYRPGVKYWPSLGRLLGFSTATQAEHAWDKWYATKPRVT